MAFNRSDIRAWPRWLLPVLLALPGGPLFAASDAGEVDGAAEPESENVPEEHSGILVFENPVLIDPETPTPEFTADMFTPPGRPRASAEAGGQASPDQADELAAEVSRFRENLREQEQESGPWGEGMVGELMQLGQALQREGDHQQAVEVFDRALHVTRINQGLESLAQIRPVRELVDSHLALGQWEEADRQQHYSLYVHTRNLGKDNPELVPELERLARWSISSFYRGLGEQPLAHLVNAYGLYAAAHRLVEEHQPLDDPRRPELLNKLAGVAYVLSRRNIGERPDVQRAVSRAVDEVLVLDPSDRTRSLAVTNGYSHGEEALLRLTELYARPEMQDMEDIEQRRARALARLGDWYLLFDRRRAATERYREAWNVLAEEDPRAAAGFFSEVVFLPGFTTFVEEQKSSITDLDGEEPNLGYLDLQLDISRYGSTRNVSVVGEQPEMDGRMSRTLQREVQNSTLRPRMVDGEPVDTEAVVYRIPYWY